ELLKHDLDRLRRLGAQLEILLQEAERAALKLQRPHFLAERQPGGWLSVRGLRVRIGVPDLEHLEEPAIGAGVTARFQGGARGRDGRRDGRMGAKPTRD